MQRGGPRAAAAAADKRLAPHQQCERELHAFLVDRLGPDFQEMDADTHLLELGLLDSIMMQVLLAHIEDRWAVTVPPEVVRPETFGSIRQMAKVVLQLRRKHQSVSHDGALEAMNGLMESYGIERLWVDLPAARQHLLACSGSGPPLLLLPGLGSPASAWGTLLRSLRGRRRALALDLPGLRVSEPLRGDDQSCRAHTTNVIELIERVIGEPCVLGGHSAGAMVAADVAHRRPDLVRALIVVSFGRVREGEAWWRELRRLADDPDAFWRRAFADPPPLTAGLRKQLGAILASAAYRDFLDAEAVARLDHLLAGLSLPTLFVGGMEDRIIEPCVVEDGAQQIPGAKVAWIPRCGHFAPSEKPEEVLVYFDQFLREALARV